MRFELYRDISKCWRWRLRDAQQHVIAEAGDGYKKKSQCLEMISHIKTQVPEAEIVEIAGNTLNQATAENEQH